MAFETFTGRRVVTKEPRVTLLKQGCFNFNSGVMKIFTEQAVEYLQLLYDQETNWIAFKPCSPKAPGAYKLRRLKGVGQLSGASFLKYCNIPFGDSSRSFPAVWDRTQGLLIVKDIKVRL